MLTGLLTVRPAGAAADLAGVVRVGGTPHKDVVVWLGGVPGDDGPARTVLDQRNLTFLPRVVAVRVGTRVEMPNNDRVFHNVFSFKDGKRFDLGLYPVGTTRIVQFDQPGLSRIFCNIHPTMAAYVLAVDGSRVAVSDGEGRFAMPNVPPGTYEYHLWRPGAEPVKGSLTVMAGRTVEVNWP
jgi:plastocyanin